MGIAPGAVVRSVPGPRPRFNYSFGGFRQIAGRGHSRLNRYPVSVHGHRQKLAPCLLILRGAP
jgi:hypothetical protein